MSLAKGPVGIIGLVLLAGGVLGLLFGSTDFTTNAPDGDVTGGTFLGIEGNGWTWLGIAGSGLLLLISAPLHWGAKTMAQIVGIAMAAACIVAIVDGSDVFGVAAVNRATMVVFGAAAVALLVVAMLPRVDRKKREVVVADRKEARHRRFRRDKTPATTTPDETTARTPDTTRDETRVEEPVSTPERRV